MEVAEPPVAHRLANHQGSPMGQSMANAPRVWTAFGMRFLPPGAAHCRRPGGKAFQRRTPNMRGAFAARDLHLTDLQMCSTGSCVARKCAIPHLARIWNEKRVTTHEQPHIWSTLKLSLAATGAPQRSASAAAVARANIAAGPQGADLSGVAAGATPPG